MDKTSVYRCVMTGMQTLEMDALINVLQKKIILVKGDILILKIDAPTYLLK